MPAITHLKKDPILATLIDKVGPKTFMTANTGASKDVYFALLDSIVSQQLSIKAADTIFKRFLALFPDKYPAPDYLLALPVETLRSAGLSFQKAAYLKNVAQFALENDMRYEHVNTLSDEEIIQWLTQIKGVGQWTVEMLLMFILERPDVFPYDDLVVRSNIIKLYRVEGQGKELKNKVLAIAEQWKPFRTTACRYIWRWKDTSALPE